MKNNKFKNFLSRSRNKISKWVYKFASLSFVKHILLFYLFITLIGSLLLYLPIAQQSVKSVGYINALFTSASAFSDTGLVTVTTATTWSIFGQAVIAILILVGGVGWFALKIYLLNILFGRPISFRSRETLAGERGSSKLGNTRRLVKISVSILFILVILATITLTLYFYFVEPNTDPFGKNAALSSGQTPINYVNETPYHNALTAFRFGLFHAISGLNNAGFDIIGSSSLQPYYHRYGLQIIFIILFVIGGIGYPVLYDLFVFFKSRFTGEKFKWSLFTKVSMLAYVSVTIIGLASTFAMEVPKKGGFWENADYGSNGDKTMALFFNTMSTRNAGFGTIEMSDLSSGTMIIYSLMMFIGSAPSSTAGGIRTTTIAIIVLGIWSRIRGKRSVRIFNRKINMQTVGRSYIVAATASFIVLIGTLVLMSSWASYGGTASDATFPMTALLFETASAFGTTGLSTGLTPQLSTASKLILILIMFIGQLGVSSTLLVWDSKRNKSRKYKLVEEDITIG